MATGFNLRLDRAAVARVVGQRADAAALQAANISAARAKRNIQAAGRIDTTAMYRGMTVEKTSSTPLKHSYLVYTPVPYAIFQELGTRAHGPKYAKAMRFRPKGSQAFVFATWVRGVTPAHFMRNALRELSLRDFLRGSL